MAISGKPSKRVVLSIRDAHAITRALSDQRRFEIFRHIAAHSCAACSDLRAAFPITAATLSHHLKELESARLIETTRRGKFVDAVICRPVWKAYLTKLREI